MHRVLFAFIALSMALCLGCASETGPATSDTSAENSDLTLVTFSAPGMS